MLLSGPLRCRRQGAAVSLGRVPKGHRRLHGEAGGADIFGFGTLSLGGRADPHCVIGSTGPSTDHTGVLHRSVADRLTWVVIPGAPTRAAGVGRELGPILMAITWVIARTVGSLVGPAVTMPAKAGFGQLVSTILEALILADGAVLLARGRWRASVPGSARAGEPGRASARLAASSRRVRSNSPAVRPAASYGPRRRPGLSWRGCLVRRGPRPAHASAVCFCGQPTRLAVSPPNARHGLGTAPASSVNPRPGRSESWRHTLKLTRKWSGRSASASVAGHGRCCCCQPRPALSSPRHGPCITVAVFRSVIVLQLSVARW